ncbi:sec-independent protein translocase protein TatB [Oryzisolibacter propanilivorax]|uniref:Sec-independent protein translocase protein TatB n=1 Tax=Oryzisolibacter propanilivorax TaxID=1527607 RepID=A0A1G9UWJ5_9BURK|nr:Sec-independent protein translocase protein TatB [Oryzisolibacter propanilivorax]SDM64147.1 sec-independent protein translocase protein TatB [Oryzisolibacter propanilivorax]
MIDIGLSKMALIGAVALVVIGPEKLPRVARTVGTLLGKAQRYVADVKAEVNRSMELDELRKMKDSVESAARDVEHSIRNEAGNFERDWNQATSELDAIGGGQASAPGLDLPDIVPTYRNPGKNWRLKRGATPRWYKAQAGVRTHVQSGAARVARFRPRKSH